METTSNFDKAFVKEFSTVVFALARTSNVEVPTPAVMVEIFQREAPQSHEVILADYQEAKQAFTWNTKVPMMVLQTGIRFEALRIAKVVLGIPDMGKKV